MQNVSRTRIGQGVRWRSSIILNGNNCRGVWHLDVGILIAGGIIYADTEILTNLEGDRNVDTAHGAKV